MTAEGNPNHSDFNHTKKLPKKMPWVIPVNCEGCGACVNLCRNGSLKMVETNRKDIFVPWLEDPNRCTGCGKCSKACVMGAISMTAYVDRAAKRFQEKRPEIPCEDVS